ncbi:MAG TPA: chemotaxis protein CheW [Candidatus Dormibacteraeota bacterium]|nr:chemotaxis protein CheW [Candidatus Dormibacteraeota bacterium]
MDEIVKDFLIESNENLDRLDQELVELESDPTSKPLLDGIFRTIHTIKGSCGFLGFGHLEKVAHVGESLLSKLRDAKLTLNAEITSGLLAMVDAVRRMLTEIQVTEQDGDNDYPELQARLKSLQGEEKAAAPSVPAPSIPKPDPPPAVNAVRIPGAQVPAAPVSSPPSPQSVEITQPSPAAAGPQDVPQFRPSASKIGGLLVDRGALEPRDLALALQEQERGDRRRLGEILVGLGFCRQEDVNAAQHALETRSQAGVETVRVGVDLLDTLMNLVGELVLARNQLLQASNTVENLPLQSVAQRINLIVTEVQEQVMKTRMQPIGNVWNKFPRTVRDLALSCGKEAHLEMEGADTELDRTIIEAIKDPLTHLVRNAIDHGIETPEVRRQSGKDAAGRLILRAFHEGGRVNIEIRDDGAGLNVDRLIQKAIERGLITTQQAQQMNERDVFNLIFLPGFSTAEAVTNVSGRGVGMDVVKTNVERISGTIDVQSAAGKGTTVRVSIPLTLAIIPALIVSCRDERFAIPQVSVLELVGLDSESGHTIELVHGVPVYRLRGSLLPLVYLDRELQLRPLDAAGAPAEGGSIIVLQAVGHQFGLVVDDVLDTEEIVVKPLSEQFKGITAYSGATIMGDGRVALILDVLGLAERSKVIAEARSSAHESRQQEVHTAKSDDRQTLLLARNGLDGQVAIPLSNVARLECFPAHLVKRVGDREVMEYRGQVIPVVRLSQLVPTEGSAEDQVASGATIEIVVHSEHGHTVAVIVDCIVDIVEEHATIDSLASRPGVMGSFVTGGNITELLDLPSIVRAAVPSLAEFADGASVAG